MDIVERITVNNPYCIINGAFHIKENEGSIPMPLIKPSKNDGVTILEFKDKELQAQLEKCVTTSIVNNGKINGDIIEFMADGIPDFVRISSEPLEMTNGGERLYLVVLEKFSPVYDRKINTTGDKISRKEEEFENILLYQLSKACSELPINEAWEEILARIGTFCGFGFGKMWMVNIDATDILLTYKWTNIAGKSVDTFTGCQPRVIKGQGIIGRAWESKSISYVKNLSENADLFVGEFATIMNVNSAVLIPILYNGNVVALLSFYAQEHEINEEKFKHLFENISRQLGQEIQRKNAEDELNNFFTLSPVLLYIAGIDGFLKKINPAFTKILGYTQDALLSKPFKHFEYPSDIPVIEYTINTANTHNKSLYYESRLVTKNGKIVWIGWTTTIVASKGLVYGIGKDITDNQKLFQERNQILDNISDCFCILNKDFKYTYTNIAAEKLLEVEPGSLLNKDIWEVFPTLRTSNFYDKIMEAVTTSKPIHFEYYSTVCNYWFEESVYPNEDGISIFFRPINDRKKAERELREAYEEKNSILESITDGFISIDGNWVVTYWNKEAEKMMDLKRETILGKSLLTVFGDNPPLKFYVEINRAFTEKHAVRFEEFFKPIETWIEVSAYPSEIGLSIYFKNITERKKAEDILNKLNRELEIRGEALAHSNSELERFAYVASHDLQEPLRMVSSFMQLLQIKYGGILDETASKYVYYAIDGAERMKRLINDLLQYSRIGRSTIELEQVDVNEVIEDAIQVFKHNNKNTDATITYGKLPVIKANKIALSQLFQNLLGNALKYRANRTPEINITCSENIYEWIFSVADNGIGIDKHFHEKIFVVFQRLHNKDEYSGTGIGLAICKKIIERFQGRIWVESEPGAGSTFMFTISKNLTDN